MYLYTKLFILRNLIKVKKLKKNNHDHQTLCNRSKSVFFYLLKYLLTFLNLLLNTFYFLSIVAVWTKWLPSTLLLTASFTLVMPALAPLAASPYCTCLDTKRLTFWMVCKSFPVYIPKKTMWCLFMTLVIVMF